MMAKLFFVLSILMNITLLSWPATAQQEKLRTSNVRDQLIKSQVETAASLLQATYRKYQNGEMSLDQAKQLGADLLRELRYGTEGYFWADTTKGVNIVLYGKKDIEGKNRLEAKDNHGTFFIKEFIAKATSDPAGGYVEYWFPKLGQSKPQPKRSYVYLFKPYEWVIGSGYYR